MWIVAPTPSSLLTLINPLWAAITSFTIFVPSPVPPAFRLTTGVLNSASRTSGGIPLPVPCDGNHERVRSDIDLPTHRHGSTSRDFRNGVIDHVVQDIEQAMLIRLNKRQRFKAFGIQCDTFMAAYRRKNAITASTHTEIRRAKFWRRRHPLYRSGKLPHTVLDAASVIDDDLDQLIAHLPAYFDLRSSPTCGQRPRISCISSRKRSTPVSTGINIFLTSWPISPSARATSAIFISSRRSAANRFRSLISSTVPPW
jgi:hypothetical protein